MSEKRESYVRSQAFLMLNRCYGKISINKRIIKRFLKCVRGE